jgi:hypothetical protein
MGKERLSLRTQPNYPLNIISTTAAVTLGTYVKLVKKALLLDILRHLSYT